MFRSYAGSQSQSSRYQMTCIPVYALDACAGPQPGLLVLASEILLPIISVTAAFC